MRSDDVVETFKRHAKDEEHTAHRSHEHYTNTECTVPILIRQHVNSDHRIEVPCQSCERNENEIK